MADNVQQDGSEGQIENTGWLEDGRSGDPRSDLDRKISAEVAVDDLLESVQHSYSLQIAAMERGEDPESAMPQIKEELLPPVDLTSSKPFHITPTPRKIALAQLFSERTGLKTNQFAMNSWGFPPIPIPDFKYGNGVVRQAPRELKSEFMGHPIFWIDPELTRMREDESRDVWSIRMYYLILAFGMWSNTEISAEWVNYPRIKGIQWDQSDVDAYHHIGNPPTIFDRVEFLTGKDLLVSAEEMTRVFGLTITSITESVKSETMHYTNLQVEALRAAKQVLGWKMDENLPHELPVELGLPDSIWESKSKNEVISALDAYVNLKLRPGQNTPREVADVYEYMNAVMDEITVILMSTDYVIGMLSIPANVNAVDESSYSSWISLLNMTLHSNDDRSKFYDFRPMINEMMNGEKAQLYYAGKTHDDLAEISDDPAGEAFAIIRDMTINSMDRLRLELMNHKRAFLRFPRVDSLGHMHAMESAMRAKALNG